MADAIAGFAAELLLAHPRPPVRVAWVTTWDVACGIAEYSRHLVAAVDLPGVVLADRRTAAASGVVPAWSLTDPGAVEGLGRAVVRHDPGVVVIQQQPGLFPWAVLPALLGQPALHGRVVCATLHNTQELAEAAGAVREAAVAALGRLSRVVVHTVRDLDRLARLGLMENTVLIPQGAPPPLPPGQVREMTPDAPVLLGCYGFFLPGKGIPQLIEALVLLRQAWPGARLRLVNAQYPQPLSAALVGECRLAVARAGLEAEVEFHTAFLDAPESATLLRACDLVVLPYQASKEGSSAALRSALAAGAPVAVTPLALFEEAEEAVLRLPGTDPAAIAAGLDAVLRDRAARQAVASAARDWLTARAWDSVGRRWAGMLEGLAASGTLVRAP